MSKKINGEFGGDDKAIVTLPGTVEKVIASIVPGQPDTIQISLAVAENLHREIRVTNTLQDDVGNPLTLRKGAEVQVTIEAKQAATTPKI